MKTDLVVPTIDIAGDLAIFSEVLRIPINQTGNSLFNQTRFQLRGSLAAFSFEDSPLGSSAASPFFEVLVDDHKEYVEVIEELITKYSLRPNYAITWNQPVRSITYLFGGWIAIKVICYEGIEDLLSFTSTNIKDNYEKRQ